MNDVIQYQRLASGYVPGLSEHGTPPPVVPPSTASGFGDAAPSSAELQNCRVVRAAAVGSYDILIGGGTPAPVGIGGTLFTSPPLVTPAIAGVIVGQGRVSVNPRTVLPAGAIVPPVGVAANPNVSFAIFYGASLGAVPLYAGFSNDQIVRVLFSSNVGQAAGVFIPADCDFDFSIERVIDPAQEP